MITTGKPVISLDGQTKHDRDLLLQQLHWLSRLASVQYYLAILYCTYRAWITLASPLYGRNAVAAYLFLVSEILIGIQQIPQWKKYRDMNHAGVLREPLRATGDNLPFIDVFLPCAGESVDIVLDTVRAACASDYPSDKFRVIVLDDAAAENVKLSVERLKAKWGNLYYSARSSDSKVFSKSVNLNSGLDLVDKLPGGPGEYVASVDIDMIPDTSWLRALLPPLLADEDVGAVGAPQNFYNIPKDDPLRQYAFWAFLNRFSLPIGDLSGNCLVTGSGYIIRRKALDSVGRFCVDSTVEDVLISLLLLLKKWKTATITEPIQYGLMPETMHSLLRQRRRFTIGFLENILIINSELAKRNIKWLQRQRIVMPVLLYTISRLIPAISSIMIPIVLLSRSRLVLWTSQPQFSMTILLAIAHYAGFVAQGTLQAVACHKEISSLDSNCDFWIAPYSCFAALNHCLPRQFQRNCESGLASGAVTKDTTEFGLTRTARISLTLWQERVHVHLIFVFTCGMAMAVSASRTFFSEANVDGRDTFLALLSSCAYPGLLYNFYHAIVQGLIPVIYAFSMPPPSSPRDEYLERDPVTLLAYPKSEAKEIKNNVSLYGVESAIGAAVFAFIIGPGLAYIVSYMG